MSQAYYDAYRFIANVVSPFVSRDKILSQLTQHAPLEWEVVAKIASNHSIVQALYPEVIEKKELSSADGRTRTADLLITNQLLYQLSYVGLERALRPRGRWTGRILSGRAGGCHARSGQQGAAGPGVPRPARAGARFSARPGAPGPLLR